MGENTNFCHLHQHWMDLEGLGLSEISQTEKVKCHMMAFTWNFFKKYKKLVTIKKKKQANSQI